MRRTITRILAVVLVLCLLAGTVQAHRFGTQRALLGVGEAVSYLLRATFTATDQGYSDGQVLDDPSEGIEDGQLTVVEVDGTLAIVSNKCAFTVQGTPAFGDLGFYSQAITRELGRGVVVTVNQDATNVQSIPIQWTDSGGIAMADWIYALRFRQAAYIQPQVFDGAGNPLEGPALDAYSASTDYQVAVVLGGYLSGVPWYQGQDKSLYIEGASFFISGGAFNSWTLLWRTAQGNTTPLYAAFGNYDASGTID